jgi:hypothetical protein
LAGELQTPKGRMFTSGMWSMMLAAGGPSHSTLFFGRTTSDDGAAPKLQVIIAPIETWFGIVLLQQNLRTVSDYDALTELTNIDIQVLVISILRGKAAPKRRTMAYTSPAVHMGLCKNARCISHRGCTITDIGGRRTPGPWRTDRLVGMLPGAVSGQGNSKNAVIPYTITLRDSAPVIATQGIAFGFAAVFVDVNDGWHDIPHENK